jgi:predicted alpha-1,2-mannosidase
MADDRRPLTSEVRYELPRGAAPLRREIAVVDLEIGPGDRLGYAVRPDLGDLRSTGNPRAWQDRGYASTGIAVDLVFDDGSRLSDHGLTDQHGVATTADAQGASRMLLPDQWTWKSVDLAPLVGRRIVAVELELVPAASDDLSGSVDSVSLVAWTPRSGSPADYVDTRRGSHSTLAFSRGNTVPATSLPAGFAFLTPVTHARDPHRIYIYEHVERPHLEAFAVSHVPTPWLGDYGVLHFFPALRPLGSPEERRLGFDRASERATAHRYDVAFENGIRASLAPTSHAGIAAFTFPGDQGTIVFDQVDDNGRLDIDADGTVSGYADYSTGMAAAGPRVYFVAEFDRPVLDSGRFAAGEHPSTSGYVTLDLAAGRTITMRLATSRIGIEQARHSLDLDLAHDDTVDAVAERAAAIWNERLGFVRLEGATEDQLASMYSSLYRLFLYPNTAAENAGTEDNPRWVYASLFEEQPEPHGDLRTGRFVREGRIHVANGFWDTYRTAWPAYALFDPETCAVLLDGFVQHYRDGGWMSRWSCPGYADCMVGTSSDAVVADAALKGVPLVDAVAAYDSALRDATAPSADARTGRKGLTHSIFRGYVADDVPEAMSWSLESAINDFAIARFSAWMIENTASDDPRRAEYAANELYFAGRAAAYADLFDPAIGFFQGRTPNGAFRVDPAAYDPRLWGGDYTETNGWGMAFTVPHDGAGLARLYGGAEGLRRKLDEFFATPETGEPEVQGHYGRVIHEMTEARDVRMGMLGLSNQPAHHIPYMYAFTDAPHVTQALTREAVRRLFLGSEFGQGYPGDEDNGEMSAWYVFSALGFYPLTLGAPEYVLTAPLFERSTVTLPSGSTIVIEARNQAPDNVYIKRVIVDGEPWERLSIDHARLVAGCEIVVELGPEPSAWGSGGAPASLTSADGDAPAPWRDLAAAGAVAGSDAGAAEVFDDSSAGEVGVGSGWWAGVDLGEPSSALLYTVTAGDTPGAAPADWVIEAHDGDENWTEVDRRAGETFRWSRQTRAFALANPQPWRHYRYRHLGSRASLAQLEFLTPADRRS